MSIPIDKITETTKTTSMIGERPFSEVTPSGVTYPDTTHRTLNWSSGLTYTDEASFTECVRPIREAAEKGHAESQVRLGIVFSDTKNPFILPNLQEATRLFGLAAAQGYKAAHYYLAVRYAEGCDASHQVNPSLAFHYRTYAKLI